jgi:hypothetical protein
LLRAAETTEAAALEAAVVEVDIDNRSDVHVRRAPAADPPAATTVAAAAAEPREAVDLGPDARANDRANIMGELERWSRRDRLIGWLNGRREEVDPVDEVEELVRTRTWYTVEVVDTAVWQRRIFCFGKRSWFEPSVLKVVYCGLTIRLCESESSGSARTMVFSVHK